MVNLKCVGGAKRTGGQRLPRPSLSPMNNSECQASPISAQRPGPLPLAGNQARGLIGEPI